MWQAEYVFSQSSNVNIAMLHNIGDGILNINTESEMF